MTPDQVTMLNDAWDTYNDEMKALGARITEESTNAQELAEGFRFLSRTTTAGFNMLLEKADQERPQFQRVTSEYEKVFGDNPDTYYDRVNIRPNLTYKVTGNRGDIPFMSFCVYGGGTKGMTIDSNIMHTGMEFDANGDFEMFVGPARPAGAKNWIATGERSRVLIIRQYFHDRSKPNAAQYKIECIDEIPPARSLTVEEAARAIQGVSRYAKWVVDISARFASRLAAQPNQMTLDTRDPGAENVTNYFPTIDNDYFLGWYKIADDEALIVEGTPPECLYWSLTPYNRWFESYDFRFRDTYANNSHVELESDGSFRLILSNHPPQEGNWIDVEGHLDGMLCFRWLDHKGDVKMPTLKVVKLADLNAKAA